MTHIYRTEQPYKLYDSTCQAGSYNGPLLTNYHTEALWGYSAHIINPLF